MPLDRGVLLALEAGETKQPRILATDDRPEILGVIQRTLGERFECDLAGSVIEARQKLERNPIDLAICDIEMPGESGLVLVEEIAQRWPMTAVMVLTGIDDVATAERAFQLGANGYLVKPFSSGQLLISCMIALHQRHLELAQENHMQALETRLQDLMDRAPIPMYIKDKSLRYSVANRAATDLLSLDPGGLVGHSDEEFLPPDAEALAREVDLQILDHGGTFEGEAVISIGGEERTFLSVKFPYVDDSGEIVGVSGVAADISGQKRAEKLEREFAQEQVRAVEELRHSRLETVERLARAIEYHDGATGAHVNRMARVAAVLGQLAGLESDDINLLRAAAPMHDVGKIATPDEILRKPGKLTPEEFEVMKQHTTVGHKILAGSESPLLQMAARIALTHHERHDGTGYPRGLEGEEIPLEGRIVAVADVFDALLSDRPYRPAITLDEAADLISSESGTHFDPSIASLLLDNLDEALARRG
jgi:PAS domain S-box-containing protein